MGKVLITLAMLAGCVIPAHANYDSQNQDDPLEKMNRSIFNFNMTMDEYIAKPVAQGYVAIFPKPIRNRFTNFFGNFDDVFISVNGYLQGKFNQGTSDAMRVLVNSTIGILGLFDPASHMSLPKHEADFGQTLGIWGIKNSTYFVIPVLGPSTFRDGFGRLVDWYISPWGWVQPLELQYGLLVWDLLDTRANYLETEEILDVSYDKYIFVRDAYLQKRRAMIEGNNPSTQKWDDWNDEWNDTNGNTTPNSTSN